MYLTIKAKELNQLILHCLAFIISVLSGFLMFILCFFLIYIPLLMCIF